MAMNQRLMRPSARGYFDPRTIAGIAFWLDASTSSTSTLTLDGSNGVATWADKTVNGRNATQATASNRPVLNSLGFGGKQAVKFNGGLDELLSMGNLSSVFPSAGEVILAVDLNGDTSYSLYATSFNSEYFRNANTLSYFGTFSQSRQSGVNVSAPATGRHIISIRCSSGNNQVVRVDGSDLFNASPVVGYLAGTSHVIGNNNNRAPDSPFSGWIGEVIAYSTLPSASDRQRLERSLGSKWGATVA
jgi:hypothetical protein